MLHVKNSSSAALAQREAILFPSRPNARKNGEFQSRSKRLLWCSLDCTRIPMQLSRCSPSCASPMESVQRDESGRSAQDRSQGQGNDQAAGPEQERQARRDDHRQVCLRRFAKSRANGGCSGTHNLPRKAPRLLPKQLSMSQKFDRRRQTCELAHAVRRSPTIKPFPSASPGPGRIAYLPGHRGD
jgi:hypothetical protein